MIVLFALVLMGWQSQPIRAQDDAGADIRFRLRTSVELVLVPVTVKDSKGNLVTGLRREDFRLWENDEEQTIRYFSLDPFPLSVVILVDRGLARSGEQTAEKTLPVLADSFGPEDEFAFYVFDTYPRQLLNFSRDPQELRQAIHSITVKDADSLLPENTPRGVAAGPMASGPRINTVPVGPGAPSPAPVAPKSVKTLHDALFAAGLALRTRERGRRRVVFIISDGLNSRLNVHTFDETRDLLLAEEVSVYAFGVGNARFALGTSLLSDYAGATGGDFYAPLDQNHMAQSYLRFAEQARHQYTLVYAARPAPAGREYRRIKVRVERDQVKVQARDGYFAGVPRH